MTILSFSISSYGFQGIMLENLNSCDFKIFLDWIFFHFGITGNKFIDKAAESATNFKTFFDQIGDLKKSLLNF